MWDRDYWDPRIHCCSLCIYAPEHSWRSPRMELVKRSRVTLGKYAGVEQGGVPPAPSATRGRQLWSYGGLRSRTGAPSLPARRAPAGAHMSAQRNVPCRGTACRTPPSCPQPRPTACDPAGGAGEGSRAQAVFLGPVHSWNRYHRWPTPHRRTILEGEARFRAVVAAGAPAATLLLGQSRHTLQRGSGRRFRPAPTRRSSLRPTTW